MGRASDNSRPGVLIGGVDARKTGRFAYARAL